MLRIVAGTYHVEAPPGRLECSLRGRLKQGGGPQVAAGDRVSVERLEDGSCRIAERLPRESTLSRLGAGGRREQVIVANVDRVAAVASVRAPDPDFSLLDRLLVLAELNGLAALVVLNKVDLLPDGAPSSPPEDFRAYRDAGYEILPTSAVDGTGLATLRERLEDRITVLTGASGTGKSSLIRALVPGLEIRIGEVGERSGRGRHTTVAAALYPFPPAGWVADTPGLQYLALSEVDPRELSAAFPEFRGPSGACRFADCRHRKEPGCEVRDAVREGRIARRRYRSYRALLEEAEERARW